MPRDRCSVDDAGLAVSLAGGAAAGQLVVILAAPLLTRLFDPAAFGLLAAFWVVLVLIGLAFFATPAARETGSAATKRQ